MSLIPVSREGVLPVSAWKERLAALVEGALSDKLPAGEAFDCLGLPRWRQHRSAQQNTLVKAFMLDLGWLYKANGTRPYFLKRKQDVPMVIIKPVSNQSQLRQD